MAYELLSQSKKLDKGGGVLIRARGDGGGGGGLKIFLEKNKQEGDAYWGPESNYHYRCNYKNCNLAKC